MPHTMTRHTTPEPPLPFTAFCEAVRYLLDETAAQRGTARRDSRVRIPCTSPSLRPPVGPAMPLGKLSTRWPVCSTP